MGVDGTRRAKAQRNASRDAAFERLRATSPEDALLCSTWDTFVASCRGDKDTVDQLWNDEAFMAIYVAALNSTRIAEKRRAMRRMFAYLGIDAGVPGGATP